MEQKKELEINFYSYVYLIFDKLLKEYIGIGKVICYYLSRIKYI